MRRIERYGWRPQLPDKRDFRRRVERLTEGAPVINLLTHCPPVWNQLQTGSCTGNSTGALFSWVRAKLGLKPQFTPSRLFIYYNARALEGTTGQDAGAEIRDCMKGLASKGVCPESSKLIQWPFDPNDVTVAPPAECYTAAQQFMATQYLALGPAGGTPALIDLQDSLANEHPFSFGITVYESFESNQVAANGIVSMPSIQTESVVGGHALFCIGKNDLSKSTVFHAAGREWEWPSQTFAVRNSWDETWGAGGYCFIPYAYLTDGDLASDYWILEAESLSRTAGGATLAMAA